MGRNTMDEKTKIIYLHLFSYVPDGQHPFTLYESSDTKPVWRKKPPFYHEGINGGVNMPYSLYEKPEY